MKDVVILVEDELVEMYKNEDVRAIENLNSVLDEFLNEFISNASLEPYDVADPYSLFEDKFSSVEDLKEIVETHINALRSSKGVNVRFNDEYYLDGYEGFDLEVYQAMRVIQPLDNPIPYNKDLDALFIEFILTTVNQASELNSYSYPSMLFRLHSICYMFMQCA